MYGSHLCIPRNETLFPKQNNYNILSPSSYTHISVRDLYISRIGLSILLQEICGQILGIYITDTWMWKLGLNPRNSQKRNTQMGFRCSVAERYPPDMLLTLGENDHRCTESRAHCAKPVPRNINSKNRLLLPGRLEFGRPTMIYKRDCRKKTVPPLLRVILFFS
jgi:hypothetical protein